MSVYKACDIRGLADGELTPERYQRWGYKLGLQLPPGAKFVVGGDVRESTPAFQRALVEGLCQAGLDVVDLKVLPTPMAYYAKRRLGALGCAIVTASHSPPNINGLKWMIGDRPPGEADVAALRRAVQPSRSKRAARATSKPRSLDVTFDYVAWLQERWGAFLGARCRVVLDPMHGCCAVRARRYLQAVFPQSLFSALHDTPDPTFAGRAPDCARPENLEELAEAVYRERAHLGIGFDGDGDRVALVDNEGNILTAEEATCVLLESFDGQLQDTQFVHDIKFSDRIAEVARKLGAHPIAERSGHAFIRTRMLETSAAFGAEVSGHYFFGDLGAGDDGMFTACRVIGYLWASGKSLADLRRACPAVFITHDLRVPVDPPRQLAVLRQVRKAWSQYPQSLTDGVRVNFPDGWALVRNSVTEAALTFRFESVDWASLEQLVRRFCRSLGHLGEDLWNRFVQPTGHVEAAPE